MRRGNVFQWCQQTRPGANGYTPSRNRHGGGARTGPALTAITPSHNPQGGGANRAKVLKGGSWYHAAARCRVCTRMSTSPFDRFATNGFRLAEDL